MRFLKSGAVPKGELNRLYKNFDQAALMTLVEVTPLINKVLRKCVGTQYYSLSQLRTMGHPYKSRAPGGLHPGVINVQSGEFFRSFRITGPVKTGSVLYMFIDNHSPKGEWLLNPERMIKRPWDTYLMWHLQRAISPVLGPIFAANIKLRQG